MAEYTPLQEIAYNHVRKLVLSGQLQPNVLYSETKMAKEIEISRTPMKDALVRLSQDKFIDIIPSKGFRLHQMSKEDIWSTYQARAAVEGFCAIQLAHQRGTPEGQTTVRAMEQCLHDMERLLKEPDTEDRITGLLEQDVKYHQTLVDFCRNEELMQLFKTYHYRLNFIALESLRVEGRPEGAFVEHKAIWKAITDSSDAMGIRAYMATVLHLESTRDTMLSTLPDL